MHEPFITWNLFLTAVLIPIGLFALFISIKRLLYTRDEDNKTINALKDTLYREALDRIHSDIQSYEDLAKQDRIHIKDGIKSLDVQFKLLNGSLRAAETAIEVQSNICNERHRDL